MPVAERAKASWPARNRRQFRTSAARVGPASKTADHSSAAETASRMTGWARRSNAAAAEKAQHENRSSVLHRRMIRRGGDGGARKRRVHRWCQRSGWPGKMLRSAPYPNVDEGVWGDAGGVILAMFELASDDHAPCGGGARRGVEQEAGGVLKIQNYLSFMQMMLAFHIQKILQL